MAAFKNLLLISLMLLFCGKLQAQKEFIPIFTNKKNIIIDNKVKTLHLYEVNSASDTVAIYIKNYDMEGNVTDSVIWKNGNLEKRYSFQYAGDTLFKKISLYNEFAWDHNSNKYKDIVREKNITLPLKDTFSYEEIKVNIDSILGFMRYIYYNNSLIFKERVSRYEFASKTGLDIAAVDVNYNGSYSILDDYNMISDTIDSTTVVYKHRFNNDSLVLVEGKVKYFRSGQNYQMFVYDKLSREQTHLAEVLYFRDKISSNQFMLFERLLFDYNYDETEQRFKLQRINAKKSGEVLEFDDKERIIYQYKPYVTSVIYLESPENYEYKTSYNDNGLLQKITIHQNNEMNKKYIFKYEYHQ